MGDNRYPRPLADRFWEKVVKTDTCWLWTGYLMKHRPVGLFRVNSKRSDYCPRIAWKLTYGEIPKDKYVLHHCDNATCVRPDHLYLGTQFENMRDMYVRGRNNNAKGERQGSAKLTAVDVINIRELGSYLTQQAIADLYSVSQVNISGILRKKNWKHNLTVSI